MTRNASRNTKRKKQKSSTELLEFVQDFIPVRSIHHGIIETTDNRYIKILEIEPINFMLRSEEEQFNIISSFASWLKISPQHLQFKSITRKADSDRHVRLLRQDLEGETNEECRRQAEGYIRFVRDLGNREALTRRFFLIYQYEEQRRGDSEDFGLVYSTIQTVEQNARAYFMQCGNGYPSRLRAGWMSTLINAGDGIDIDVHLHRENRSKTIDKVAQRIRLNRTKLKRMQDTSTDYEELTNSIQAGYYIKQGIANYNEDLFYLSVFVTVSAKSLDEFMWRKQQMVDMLKSMDMYVSDCRFQQEAAFPRSCLF